MEIKLTEQLLSAVPPGSGFSVPASQGEGADDAPRQLHTKKKNKNIYLKQIWTK